MAWISLLANAVMKKGESHPANVATRQIIELDACTHCGACTLHCSVAVAFAEIPNANILPSEKIASLKQLAAGKELTTRELTTIQQGMHLCTNCYRCTSVCPVGINLQELWFSAREALLRKSLPEFLLLSPLALYRGLLQESLPTDHYRAPLDRAREAITAACNPGAAQDRNSILEPGSGKVPGRLKASLESNSFSSCYRCMTCTSACPVVRSYTDPVQVLGLLPHQIMHAASLRLWDLILGARMLWDCLGCYQCQEHCPMSVRTADILFELKNLAIQHTLDRGPRESGEES
jgi:heterodisulfide reductase subunit C